MAVRPLDHWRRIPRLLWSAVTLVGRVGKARLAGLVILQIASAATLGLQLLVGRNVLQALTESSTVGFPVATVVPELAILVGSAVLLGALSALATHQQRLLTELVSHDTYERILDVSRDTPYAAFEDPKFYDQLTRARNSALQRPIQITMGLTQLLMACLTAAGIGLALVSMHPLLVPMVLIAAVPLFLATLLNSQKAYRFEYAWTPRSRERAYLVNLLTSRDAAKELRVFGATGFLRSRYDLLTRERIKRLRVFLKDRLQVALAGTVGGALGTALTLVALLWLMITGRIDIATAVAAGAAIQLLVSRFSSITRSVGLLVESSMFLDDYQTFLSLGHTTPESESPYRDRLVSEPHHLHSSEIDGGTLRRDVDLPFAGLRLEDVCFTYPHTDVQVLKGVSLEVRPGEVVALVGENGSGKTTVVKLMCQLYGPSSGRVLWGERDAALLNPDVIRSRTTVIFQDFLRYQLSAFDNIVLGRADAAPAADEARSMASEAARQVGAHGFLSELSRGYRTRLGRQFEGGEELSVGQWQRLALARAFYRGGELLILDEPTAALDPRAEHELFEQMRALSRRRSVLLISHRFSSVRSADRIYVLNEGTIAEHGSHDELMERDGLYAELFRLQAAAYLDSPGAVSADTMSAVRAGAWG